jgi:hypothetical protein
VIVAEDVEGAVNHETEQLLPKGNAAGGRLPRRDRATDVDVPDQRAGRFAEGEREHVGRAIGALPSGVEPSHPVGADERDRQPGRAPLAVEHRPSGADHRRRRHAGRPSGDRDRARLIRSDLPRRHE